MKSLYYLEELKKHIHCPGHCKKFDSLTSTLVIDIKMENDTETKSTEEIKKNTKQLTWRLLTFLIVNCSKKHKPFQWILIDLNYTWRTSFQVVIFELITSLAIFKNIRRDITIKLIKMSHMLGTSRFNFFCLIDTSTVISNKYENSLSQRSSVFWKWSDGSTWKYSWLSHGSSAITELSSQALS